MQQFIHKHIRVFQWFPAIATMIAIFILSSTPGEELGQITEPAFTTADQIAIRYTPIIINWYKVGHVIGYALLGLSLLAAFKQEIKRPFLATVFSTLVYAASDEFHQRFVPGRHSTYRDVLLDLSAATAAILIYQFLRFIKSKGALRPGRKNTRT